jgi:hypothetical protein
MWYSLLKRVVSITSPLSLLVFYRLRIIAVRRYEKASDIYLNRKDKLI